MVKPPELRSGISPEELKSDALDLILQAKIEYNLTQKAVMCILIINAIVTTFDEQRYN